MQHVHYILFIIYIVYYIMADLGVYVLASLLGAGYLMGNRKQTRQLPDDKGATNSRPVVGNNVYDSREYYNVAHKEAELVKNNYMLSEIPIKSGIIPMYYNTLHIKQDSDKIPNKDYDSKLIYDVIKELDPEAQRDISRVKNTASVINDSGREIKPSWGIVMDKPLRDTHIKDGATIDQIGGALIEGNTNLSHLNMVPFYKGNMTQDIQLDNRAKAGKLELYTGQMKLNQSQKTEQNAFFKPTAGFTNIHGSQNLRDISRFNPNNTGKKNNELPFDKVLVGPGLNKGFTNQPSGGYHQTLRVMPKSELYDNPKIATEGRVKSGAALVSKRSLVPQLYKYKPDLLTENKKGERNFTSVGSVHGRTLRPNVILRDTYRKKSTSYIAPAKAAGINKPMIAPKVKASRRNNFYNTPFRNVLSQVAQINDFGRSGYKNKLNSRALTGSKAHRIAARGYVEGQTKRPEDTARKTRKQHYINNARIYGTSLAQMPSKGPSYNPAEWAPGTTIKETTENMDRYGIKATTGGSVGQSYNPTEWTPNTTIKETTEDNYHLGGAVSHNKQITSCQDTARTTIAETTERNDHIGWFGQSGVIAGKTQYTDPARTTIKETTENNRYLAGVSGLHKKHIIITGDKARTTIKETTEKNDYIGIAGAPIHKKHISIYNDKARTTVKETTENNEHIGHVGGAPVKRTVGPNDRARTTIKETTEVDGHMGNIGGTQLQSGRGYMTTNHKAKNTNRQFTGDKEYIGPALSNNTKTTSYDSIYNARFNTNKTKISRGRKPTDVGPVLGHQEINVESKKIDNDRKSRYTGMKSSTIGNIFNPDSIHFTSERNHLPQHETRLDVGILDAFKQNPLTQSLSSY